MPWLWGASRASVSAQRAQRRAHRRAPPGLLPRFPRRLPLPLAHAPSSADWSAAEAQEQVRGFPGARLKGFHRRYLASAFVRGEPAEEGGGAAAGGGAGGQLEDEDEAKEGRMVAWTKRKRTQ